MKKSYILIHITLAILVLPLMPVQASGSLDTWNWRNPLPTGSYLSGVASGVVNGTSEFVAVGYDSTILLSQNGVTWYQQSSPPNITLTGITFGGTTFVAVGLNASSGPAILTSTDGSTWSPVTGSLGTVGLLAVTYGGGMFVAVGYGGTVMTSPDGRTWSNPVSIGGNTLNAVAYGVITGVGGFVAVGSSGGIFTSTDGDTWTSEISGTPYALAGVAYGNGTWAVVGQSIFLRSFNGIAWGATSTGYQAVAVTYDANDSLFVAWGNSEQPGLFTSTNGLSWKVQGPATGGTTALFNALAYNGINKTFVAVGYGGAIATSTSPYGTNWLDQETSVTAEPLNAVAFGNLGNLFAIPVFVIGGGMYGGNSGSMFYSLDGLTWSAGILNSNVLAGTVVYGITYGSSSGNPLFVAAGTAYSGGPPNAEVLTSPDAINWSLTWTNPPGVYINQLNAVTFGNGEFVSVAEGGAILTSSDATSWFVQASVTTSSLYGVTYGGGQFVAVGDGGEIVRSTEGATWTAAAAGQNATLYGVAYGNGNYVAVGKSSAYYPVILTSSDGAAWTATYTGTTRFIYLNAVTFNNGTFVATGQNGQLLTSPDGNTWTPQSSGTGNQLNAVVFGESQFVTVGASGTILGTGPLPPPPMRQLSLPAINPLSGIAQFTFAGGTPGSTVNLQASTDLKNWSTKATATVDASGNAMFSDTLEPNIPGLYYRIEQLP